MQYSPKLKKAMDEIIDVLKKHDIAGFVILHTPGYSEYLNHCTTSYSCATVTPEGVRLRLKSAEVGKEKARQIAADTCNMVIHFAKHLAANAMFYMDTEKILREKFDVQDLGGDDHTSHQQQNN